MNRKKLFTTNSGAVGMIVDCDTYEVEFFKSDNKDAYNRQMIFRDKEIGSCKIPPTYFHFDWDKDEDGGRLEIRHRDRWGSEMIFKHYEPSDLKGMFDFIAKGYNIDFTELRTKNKVISNNE